MTRPGILRPLVIPLLALLAAAPPAASAARQEKTAFSILVEGVARLEQFPTLPPEFHYDFRASGALKDSGPVSGNTEGLELLGKRGTYALIVTSWTAEAITFELYQSSGEAWPGTLLGSGTGTYERKVTGWWLRDSLELDGILVGR